MGIVKATNVFQARLVGLFSHLPHVLVYINDIAIITNWSFEDHLKKVIHSSL